MTLLSGTLNTNEKLSVVTLMHRFCLSVVHKGSAVLLRLAEPVSVLTV